MEQQPLCFIGMKNIKKMEGYQDYFLKNNYKSSVLLALESGFYYYFSDYTEDTINQMKESKSIMKSFQIEGMQILPADVYAYSIKKEAASREAFDIFRSKCVDMEYDTYYNNCKKAFLENMNQLKERGVKIEYSFNNSYQMSEYDQLNYDLIYESFYIRGIDFYVQEVD